MLNDVLVRNKTVVVCFHKKYSNLVYETIYDRLDCVKVEQECLPDGRRMRIVLKNLRASEIIGLYRALRYRVRDVK